MTGMRCSCCGEKVVVLLAPAKGCKTVTPTIVCHRCDHVGGWPITRRALRRTR